MARRTRTTIWHRRARIERMAPAHHSFAVFFDGEKSIAITGVVTQFKFVNPHGLIVLQVKNKDAVLEEWKVETNAPAILRRFGWAPDRLTAGETITVEGWPGRNDPHYGSRRSHHHGAEARAESGRIAAGWGTDAFLGGAEAADASCESDEAA